MKEFATVAWQNVSTMWPIRMRQGRSLLVQSLATSTSVCGFVTNKDSSDAELVTFDLTGKFCCDEPSIWCGAVSHLAVQVTKRVVRWVDVASSPPVLVHSTDAPEKRRFVVAAGDGNSLITIDDRGQPWIHQMANGGRVESSQVSFGRPLLGASCVAYDSDSGMLAVGLWPKIGEESSLPYLMLKEVQHKQGRGRFRNPLEIPLGSAKAEASVPRSIVVTSARSVGLTSQSGVVVVCGLGDGRVVVWSESAEAPGWTVREVDVGGIRPVVLTKLPSIHGLFVRGSYPYLLTADDAGKELILRNVNPLEGGASIECAVELDDDAFAVTGGQSGQQTAVLAVVTSEPSLTFAALTPDEPCELQTRHRPVGGGQTAMRVEHVTGDIYAVSTITVGAHKGLADKENTPDNDGDGSASSSSTVRLVNGSSLREMCSIPAKEREYDVTMGDDDDDDEQSGCTVEVSSLATFDLGDAGDSGIVYLCVGSCVVSGPAQPPEIDEAEPSKGFVKVYRIDPTASLLGGADAKVCERVTVIEVTGVPYQMASLVDEGSSKPFLLCTVNNVVEVYAVEQEPEGGLRLGIVTKRHLHIASIFMQVQGNNVAVGDMTRGVTLLQFDPKSSSLSELARYEFSLWPTALQFLSNGKILVADDRFNIFLMERQREIGKSHSGSPGYSLQTVGQLHLGLLVNCIRPGSLRSTTTTPNRSDEEGDQFLLCTIEGALVSLKSIENSAVERMLQIQHAVQVNIQKQ
ncbi:hypothetical protein FOZ61_004103, partial [Perkinsus olseni]